METSPNNASDLPLLHEQLQEQRQRIQVSNGILFSSFPKLEMRLRKERQLFYLQWKSIFGCCFFLNYFAIIVFRNIAYYRFEFGHLKLKDIGHEVFPQVKEVLITELPMYVLFTIMLLTGLGAFIGHDRMTSSINKPYFVNSLRRVLIVFSTGHFLRALTYLSTSLPAPAEHCLNKKLIDPPPNLLACFYRFVSSEGNCGDLNFSGHVLLIWMGTCYVYDYGWKFWGLPKHGLFHWIMTSLCITCGLIQISLILALRHHYSLDVILASYVSPLLWSYYQFHLHDLLPDEGLMESELVKESIWPKWLRLLNFLFFFFLLVIILASLAIAFGGNFQVGAQNLH